MPTSKWIGNNSFADYGLNCSQKKAVSDLIEKRLASLGANVPTWSTLERMEDLLIMLAAEAEREATPETAKDFACAILFVRTGLKVLAGARGK